MSELVTELRVIGTDSNIFDTDMNYVIPLWNYDIPQILLPRLPKAKQGKKHG